MLTFPGLRHHQIAYVTTDLDEALRRLDQAFGLDRFHVMDTIQQPSYPDQPPLKLALVRTAGTEFEVIQPMGRNDQVWSDPLPKTGEFAMLFHHIAVTVHGPLAEYDRYRAGIDTAAHPVVTEGWAGDDVRWFYTDERATLGHFVEHCWFSPKIAALMASWVPMLASS